MDISTVFSKPQVKYLLLAFVLICIYLIFGGAGEKRSKEQVRFDTSLLKIQEAFNQNRDPTSNIILTLESKLDEKNIIWKITWSRQNSAKILRLLELLKEGNILTLGNNRDRTSPARSDEAKIQIEMNSESYFARFYFTETDEIPPAKLFLKLFDLYRDQNID